MRQTLRQHELIDRLHWFVWLRWAAVAGGGGAVTVSLFVFELPLPAAALYFLLGVVCVYNILCHAFVDRYYRDNADEPSPLSPSALANLQILIDLALLALLIHYAGGVENPFVLFFIFHMIIASILLSRRAAFTQATYAVLLVAALALGEHQGWLHHYPLTGLLPADLSGSAYVWAFLFVFIVTMYTAVYMATSITTRLRQREEEIVRLSRDLEDKASQLEASYEQLSQTQQLQTTYMRKTSHELRSPLAAVESLLVVVLEGLAGDVAPKANDLVQRAVYRIRDLLRTVNDLLVLLRSRDVQLERDRRELSLAELVTTIVELLGPRASGKGIEVTVKLADDLPTLYADPEGMEQLVTNLLANALKYTEENGKVEIRLSAREGGVELVFADTGIGIPKDEIPRLFDDFFRATNARSHGEVGSGLGLSIVKTIVDHQGGAIEVESELGHGSTFTVWLPRRPPTVPHPM